MKILTFRILECELIWTLERFWVYPSLEEVISENNSLLLTEVFTKRGDLCTDRGSENSIHIHRENAMGS